MDEAAHATCVGNAIQTCHWSTPLVCPRESFFESTKLLHKPESSPLIIYEGAGNQNQKQSDSMQSFEQVEKRPAINGWAQPPGVVGAFGYL